MSCPLQVGGETLTQVEELQYVRVSAPQSPTGGAGGGDLVWVSLLRLMKKKEKEEEEEEVSSLSSLWSRRRRSRCYLPS